MRFEFSETRHAQFVSLAPPRAVAKPQWMRMSRTLRPYRVNELIMHVLLRIVDDALNVARDVVAELPKPDGVVQGPVVVIDSDCCVQIVNQQPDDVFLVDISNGHLSRLRTPQTDRGFQAPRFNSESPVPCGRQP
ncbi:MAG TPA: hypothetical protein VI485_08265 [Vicinamibacterales bacterium]|nr:hypothetical protein [Vicinamibacterales bacterium]